MAMESALSKMLQFIDNYQQQRPDKTSITIVRELRAYTRASYANRFWELVAGNNPDFIAGELDDQSVVIAGQSIDFAHFIAALSDQSWGGNLFSLLADGFLWATSRLLSGYGYDSREYTAAIGDTAQPIEIYLDKHGCASCNADQLADLLGKFASPQDYASDITAYMVGRFLYESPGLSLKMAIQKTDELPYAYCVQRYLTQSFGAEIQTKGQVQNIENVKDRIGDRIRAYLLIKRDIIKTDIFNRFYWKQVRPALIHQATEYFVAYLLQAVIPETTI